MARLTTVAGMTGELTTRVSNLETGHAARTIYEVWRDICVKTKAWRVVLSVDTTLNQTVFTLSAGDGADIDTVVNVQVNKV